MSYDENVRCMSATLALFVSCLHTGHCACSLCAAGLYAVSILLL